MKLYIEQVGGSNSVEKNDKRKRNEGLTINIRKQPKLIPINIPENMEVITFITPGKLLTWDEAEFFWQFIFNFSDEIKRKNLLEFIYPISSQVKMISHQHTMPEYDLFFTPPRILGLFETEQTEWFSKNIAGNDCHPAACASSQIFTENCQGCGPNVNGKILNETDNQEYKLSSLLVLIKRMFSNNPRTRGMDIRIFLFCCSAISNPLDLQNLRKKKRRGMYLIDLLNNIEEIEDQFLEDILNLDDFSQSYPIQISVLCHGEILLK